MESIINNFFQMLDQITGEFKFVCDSRTLQIGDIFVALSGENTDGHHFVQDALDKGARLAVVSQSCNLKNERLFFCEDPLFFIKACALWNLQRVKPIVIGITGSCGKTTTKHFLEKLLKTKYSVFATHGNFNSQIGIPLSLCSLKKEHRLAIIEMGMSQAGDIKKFMSWIHLDYAVISSIGLAHVENFIDQEVGVAQAKGEILQDSPIAIFNEKTDLYEPFKSCKNKFICKTSSITKTNSGYLFDIDGSIYGPYLLTFNATPLLENMHLALACAFKLGVTCQDIEKEIGAITTEKQRLQSYAINDIQFIDDSYNASPSSMKSAISYLKSKEAKRKIAVIGPMKELGAISQKEHIDLFKHLRSGVDSIYCLGEETYDLSKKLGDKSLFFTELMDLKNNLQKDLLPGDLVLIKGSHSTKLHSLMALLEFSL